MSLACPGETVNIEYLEIDELEVKCWIKEYSCIGYLDNTNMSVGPDELEKKEKAIVSKIDSSGEIKLKRYSYTI